MSDRQPHLEGIDSLAHDTSYDIATVAIDDNFFLLLRAESEGNALTLLRLLVDRILVSRLNATMSDRILPDWA